MNNARSSHSRRLRTNGKLPQAVERFASNYGWWRVVAIPVLTIITVWLLIDIVVTSTEESKSGTSANQKPDVPVGETAEGQEMTGPDPADSGLVDRAQEKLPPGGPFTLEGEGTYRPAGEPGQDVGEGTERVVRYSIEVEEGIDTAPYGGDEAFAALVDATLADPRGWTEDSAFQFINVAPHENPDTRIQLTSLATTAELCGANLDMETSCHTTITGESTVVINESRWVRGAQAFEGDLGNYRQYLINHEFGHAIGYSRHQTCSGDGELAPVMMQQTLSLNNAELFAMNSEEVYPDEETVCEPNPWPYPNPDNDDPHAP